jgi:hypothetical protein
MVHSSAVWDLRYLFFKVCVHDVSCGLHAGSVMMYPPRGNDPATDQLLCARGSRAWN